MFGPTSVASSRGSPWRRAAARPVKRPVNSPATRSSTSSLVPARHTCPALSYWPTPTPATLAVLTGSPPARRSLDRLRPGAHRGLVAHRHPGAISFGPSFLAYKRNEIERFERYVTDWEFREYAYHL
jgi:hypothetical protein